MGQIPTPYKRGLVLVRHRLASGITAHNLWKISQVHAASLRAPAALTGQGGPDKQETPGMAIPEASTDHEPSAEAPGGCSGKCA